MHQIKELSNKTLIRVASPTQDTPEKMVEAILRGAPDQFVLVGHSMGGWLCLEVMRRAKQRVTKLCLLNTTESLDTPTKKAKREEMMRRVEAGEFREVVKELVHHFVHNSGVKDKVEKMFMEVGEQAFVCQEKSMLVRKECASILPSISCPTLVIHAAQDRVFSLEDHQRLASAIPHAKLAVIEDCGHMSPMEKPEAVTTLLSAFI